MIASPKRNVLIFVSLVAIAAIFVFTPSLRKHCCASEYHAFTSPNGNYRIAVYRIPVLSMVMPGGSGDAPGFVRLYDKDNRILEEKDVELVQLVDDVKWSGSSVHIKLFADWTLPSKSQ